MADGTLGRDTRRLRPEVESLLLQAGACAAGVVPCRPLDSHVVSVFTDWLAGGNAADMHYLSNHQNIRSNPELLLEGAESIICCAFGFHPEIWRAESLPRIAAYAYGDDYHEALRERLKPVCESLVNTYGGECRICIDTAPVMERLLAVQSGVAIRGCNGAVIVPGYGSMVFLAEIVTTIPYENLTADERVEVNREIGCKRCGACIDACPGHAIVEDGCIDARRCISYLSIEHRGEWEGTGKMVMETPAGRNTLYGCDICLRVCPHNKERELPPDPMAKAMLSGTSTKVLPSDPMAKMTLSDTTSGELPEFQLRPEYVTLDAARVRTMTQEEFSAIFRHSAIKRAKLAGLQRNARNCRH